MAWITTDSLRSFVGNQKAGDDELLSLAADVACGKVEELCGPIAYTTITDELVEVYGSTGMCLSYPATRGVTSITEYRTGVAQDLTLWRWDGQLLKRRDGYRQWRSLLVTYDIGYYDATAPSPVAPAWARSMALHIGQQWLKTVGKFRSASGTDPVGFLVPFPALEAGRDYMLVPRIG